MMDRAESALQFISPVERDVWVSMGMSLQSEYGDNARDIWMDWSRGADSFRESDARAVWKSFKRSGLTLASLFHEAKQAGWKDDDNYVGPTQDQINAQRAAQALRQSAEGIEQRKKAAAAAVKAAWIMDQTVPEQHAYLHKKGFPELQGLVWRPTQERNILVIPMFVAKRLTSVQFINRDGEKKFLSNGVTAQAEYVFDNASLNAQDYWVEGFATGLSLRECLAAIKVPYRIHCCFSANNLKRIAHSGFVVADNDISLTGQNAAIATGLPYWMPETVGTDFNDFHKAMGTFKASQVLRKWLQSVKEAAMA